MNIYDFTGINDRRAYLRNPFNIDGKTVGTDGHIILIMPESSEYSPLEGGVPDAFKIGVSSTIKEVESSVSSMEFIPMPRIAFPGSVTCGICKGTKQSHACSCPECSCTGCVDLSNDYSKYRDITCMSCNGAGDTFQSGMGNSCSNCNGLGYIYNPSSKVEICGIYVAHRYLKLIYDFQELKIAAAKNEKKLYFKSGDYMGVVMGMRE